MAVDMAAEGDALFFDASEVSQGKDLKAPGIGQDRPVPAHKTVNASPAVHEFISRPDMEMIGVAQRDLGADGFQVIRGQPSLDRACCRDVHKDRCLYDAVYSGHAGALGAALFLQNLIHGFVSFCMNYMNK